MEKKNSWIQVTREFEGFKEYNVQNDNGSFTTRIMPDEDFETLTKEFPDYTVDQVLQMFFYGEIKYNPEEGEDA